MSYVGFTYAKRPPLSMTTLSQYSAQEVFDHIVGHLRQQGERSTDGRQCLYRGPGTLKCAAGCLISDDEYYPGMEGMSWVLITTPTSPHRRLISALQFIHDSGIYAIEKWENAFRITAEKFGLKYNAPETRIPDDQHLIAYA